MAFHSTVRPGLIQIRVLDLDKTLKFYTDILGLDEVGRTSDGRVMLKCYDEFDHHSVVLRKADKAGLDYVGFKVLTAAQLEEIRDKTEKFGYKPGYCGIKPSFSLNFTPNLSVSSPLYVIFPESAFRLSVIIFISVDLPEPLGPSRANIPGVNSAVNPVSAFVVPYDFEILFIVKFILFFYFSHNSL